MNWNLVFGFSAVLAGFFMAIQDTIAHHKDHGYWLQKLIPWNWLWTCEGKAVKCGPVDWKLDGWHINKVLSWICVAVGIGAAAMKVQPWFVGAFWFVLCYMVFHVFYNVIFPFRAKVK